MKYKLFLIDADNTLFDYDAAETIALERAFGEYGLKYGINTLPVYREINTTIWKEREAGIISADELKIERFNRLFKRLGIDLVNTVEFAAKYLYCLSECSQLIDDAEKTCAELYSRGAKLVLFTNGLSAVQRPRLLASPLSGMFSAIAISEELGTQKPDPAMVFAAMDLVNHDNLSTVLIVGDSQTADIGAAVNANVDSCLVSNAMIVDENLPRPTYVISRLSELPVIAG